MGAERRILVSRTSNPQESGACASLNVQGFLAQLKNIPRGEVPPGQIRDTPALIEKTHNVHLHWTYRLLLVPYTT